MVQVSQHYWQSISQRKDRMKPFSERTPDFQYRDLLARIRSDGRAVETQQEEPAHSIVGHQMRFNLENGFPLVTERDISGPFLDQAFGELFCFLNGGQTLADLESFGCRWWKRWATEKKCAKRGLQPGDLGPGSYGAAWRRFPTIDGITCDQITNLMEQIQELPHLRTHFLSPWIPQYTYRGGGKQQKVVVVPCHGWVHIFLYPESRELVLHHFQRSADAPVGLVFNIAQYALLAMMLAQIFGYTAKELVYTISDAHIYDMQRTHVEELISREPRRFPTVQLDPEIRNIFAFRQEHIHLTDYDPHPAMVVPTPV